MDFSHGFTHPPEDRGEQGTRRTYYRQDGVVVTDRYFIVPGRRYPISDLNDLRTSRTSHSPGFVLATWASGLLFVAVLAMVANHSFKDSATTSLVVFVSMLPIAITGAAWRLRRWPLELWAHQQGRPVMLLRMTDPTRYGQICRALMRAHEDR